MLQNTPFHRILDLALVFYVIFPTDGLGSATIGIASSSAGSGISSFKACSESGYSSKINSSIKLQHMVKEVNTQEISDQERLSNQVYIFHKETHMITM